MHGARKVIIGDASPPNLPRFYLIGDLPPRRQAECRRPSKVPFRAPVRNAVHSEWVKASTGPAGILGVPDEHRPADEGLRTGRDVLSRDNDTGVTEIVRLL